MPDDSRARNTELPSTFRGIGSKEGATLFYGFIFWAIFIALLVLFFIFGIEKTG